MSKSKKQQTALGKSIYLPQTDTFHKCTAVNELGQPIKVQDGTTDGLEIKTGSGWVVANTRTKVIQALFNVIRTQNLMIDEMSVALREQELEKQQKN